MQIFSQLCKDIEQVLNGYNIHENISLSLSKNKHYDFQINNLVKYQNNKQIKNIALSIEKFLKEEGYIFEYEITEKYFINFSCDFTNVKNVFQNIENIIQTKKKFKLLIDYGGPNIGKPLHVGHLRSLNIGRSLYNINELADNTVKSDIHLGDWGMPVAQIISFCEIENINLNTLTIEELVEIYPKASELYIGDKEFNDLSKSVSKQLNELDKDTLAKWKIIKDISIESLKNTLSKLNHDFDLWLGESDVNKLIPKMLKNLEKNKKIKNDDGAFISTQNTDPKILITKSDGSYLYLTTDLATVLNRLEKEKLDKTIYVVDKRQSLHFQQLFSCLKYFEFDEKEYQHVSFGTLNDSKGNPFKTRDGGTKELIELFDETKAYIKKINQKLNVETIEILANTVLTYSDLITNRKTDYKFDLEKFTNINGKTGIYIQYSYVRAKKLYKDSKQSTKKLNLISKSFDLNDKKLVKSLIKFEYYFKQSLENNEPHHLADYLYELSNSFNSMYQGQNILSNKNEEIKSNKIYLTKTFLNYSELIMKSLGIEPVSEM